MNLKKWLMITLLFAASGEMAWGADEKDGAKTPKHDISRKNSLSDTMVLNEQPGGSIETGHMHDL